MQIQQNPEGLANLLTRAVNDDGGIERDLEQKAKAMYYDDAIKDTMLEKMPETLEELAEFAKKVDEKVNKKSSGDGRRTLFVPKFGENLENALMNIGNVLANEGTDNTQNTGLSVKTTTKVIEEIKRNNAKGKAVADIVLRNMSADEKKALFERQSYYQPTTKQIEAEIKKFEPAIAIAEKLRKDYVDTLARLEINSNAGVMEKETRTVYNRLK